MFRHHEQLCTDGWHADAERFWGMPACFYDLGMIKTVILVKEKPGAAAEHAEIFYWKHGGHGLPAYLDPAEVELRRYKLHHSMNDLLWHDHGDRPLWPT